MITPLLDRGNFAPRDENCSELGFGEGEEKRAGRERDRNARPRKLGYPLAFGSALKSKTFSAGTRWCAKVPRLISETRRK